MSIRSYIFVALALASAVSFSAEADKPAVPAKSGGKRAGVVIDKSKKVGDRLDLSDTFGQSSADKKKAAHAAALAHKREDVCLDYAGDVLTWGQVEDYVDLQLLEAPLNIPPQATLEQINKIVAASKIRLAEVAVNTYLREALMVPLAVQAGLSVSDAELNDALDRATKKASLKKHGAEIVPKLREPGSFFSKYQKNYLLSRKYRSSVLDRELAASPAEIEACISNREAVIAAAIATNAAKRVVIEGYLEKIRAGELDFGETAYEFSDCGSSMDNGDWGEFDRDSKLVKPLKDFIFAPSKAEMSDVIETPYSYHIVKILERHYDGEEEIDEEDGEAAPAAARASGHGSAALVVSLVLACAVVLSVVLLVFVPRQAVWRYYALLPVWGTAVLAAAVAFKFAAGDDSDQVPTRVHVAHIMLEKEEVPPSLTAETARAEVCKQKLAKRTIALQVQLLDAAKTNGTLKCAVRMTLLNKTKNLRKKTKERKANHAR